MNTRVAVTFASAVTLILAGSNLQAGEAEYSLGHVFTNTPTDGGCPGELFRSPGGILWGVTALGGKHGSGTLFRMGSDGGAYAVLADLDLAGAPKTVLQGVDGMLYVLVRNNAGTNGFDSIARIHPDGSSPTVLHRFGVAGDGVQPTALIQGSDGLLYGSTAYGGSPRWGTVFKLDPDGSNYRILVSFSIGSDEGGQVYGIMEGSDGLLYGTCAGGGISPGANGTLFQVRKDGAGCRVLHLFNRADGCSPHAKLIEGSEGALFGTCTEGGHYDKGTLFRMAKDGSGFAILHMFGGTGISDAKYPHGRLLEGTDGALYGTAGGGVEGEGTIFRINKDGTGYQVLRSLQRSLGDSIHPYVGVVEGDNGILFGTTDSQTSSADGFWQYGIVFQVQGPIGPVLRLEQFAQAEARLSWPSSWKGFSLEERDPLAGTNWMRSARHEEDNGVRRWLQVELSNGPKFYRLAKPRQP